MQVNKKNDELTELLVNASADAISKWNVRGQYTLYFNIEYEMDDDNTFEVVLGYATEGQYKRTLKDVEDEREARWYCCCLLQASRKECADFLVFNADFFKDWLGQFEFDDEDDEDEQFETVRRNLFLVLTETCQRLHKTEMISRRFGKELPIVIFDEVEECDYSLANLNANKKANGNSLPEEYVEFYQEIAEENSEDDD